MPENMYCNSQKGNSKEFEDNYDDIAWTDSFLTDINDLECITSIAKNRTKLKGKIVIPPYYGKPDGLGHIWIFPGSDEFVPSMYICEKCGCESMDSEAKKECKENEQ